MSYTGRIRIIIILIAIVPPLVTMGVSYFITKDKLNTEALSFAQERLELYDKYQANQNRQFEENLQELLNSESFASDMRRLATGRSVKLTTEPNFYQFDFLEVTDQNRKVLASFNRPGLIGDNLSDKINRDKRSSTIEYDLNGRHPSLAQLAQIDNEHLIFCGQFINSDDIELLANLLSAKIDIVENADSLNNQTDRMPIGQLYNLEHQTQVKLLGGSNDQFYLLATFDIPDNNQYLVYTLGTTAVVAVVSIIIALLLGIYITGRTKREIDNLITATDRVARGDFNHPVMAYEEGEFSQLADSFTEMMFRLRKIQNQLATTEKIAAWQTVGRKIAHEIKNPLSPISISVDDLKSAYNDKLPNFDKTLNETTTTIKVEVERLSKLLDEFVSFARMRQPTLELQPIKPLITSLEQFYKSEINSRQLTIDSTALKNDKYKFDEDLLKQVLINLIKNGFEATNQAQVEITFKSNSEYLVIMVSDNGPGFSEEKLANSFEPYQTTKPHGSGLGLVICHRIIHDHNGTLELSNAESGGAVVTITLPGK